MKYKNLYLLVVLVSILTSCSMLKTPLQPLKPAVYEYEHEILDVRADCAPDEKAFLEFANGLAQWGIDRLDRVLAEDSELAAVHAKSVTCAADMLQTHMSQRGANGWKLIHFEVFEPTIRDLYIEYQYRLVWER